MREQPADVVAPHVGQTGVTGLVVEQVVAVAPQRLVRVHTRAVVHEERLRHERRGLAPAPRHVLHDVLVVHDLVGSLEQRAVPHVDLRLAGGADLVVLHLDRDAHLLHLEHHLGTQVLVLVHRRDREIAFLVPGPVAARAGLPGTPHAFGGVDEVVALVLPLVEAGLIEDVELALRAPVARLGDPGRLQVVLGLLRDVARVARVALAGDRVANEAEDVQRCRVAERVQDRGGRIRDEQHVGLLDLLEATDARTVETVPVFEAGLGQLRDRHAEVLGQAGEVAEPKVHDLDAGVLGQLQHVFR